MVFMTIWFWILFFTDHIGFSWEYAKKIIFQGL